MQWDPPRSGSDFEYVVTVTLHFSYNPDRSRFTEKVMRLSSNTTTAVILGLLPGSQFNVSIHTESEGGGGDGKEDEVDRVLGPAVSQLFWTEVGVPKVPEPPTIIQQEIIISVF